VIVGVLLIVTGLIRYWQSGRREPLRGRDYE
jgi:hypothetical protein